MNTTHGADPHRGKRNKMTNTDLDFVVKKSLLPVGGYIRHIFNH